MGEWTHLWSSSLSSGDEALTHAIVRAFHNGSEGISNTSKTFEMMLPVRCIKDVK